MSRVRQYVFGYGSLVSARDVARTLGRTPVLVYPVRLDGWVREWGVAIDNSVGINRCIRLADGSPVPGCIVVLNVRRSVAGEAPTNPNGVLFEVDDDDLRELDSRESHYERLDVTDDIIGGPGGLIYTYSGLGQFWASNVETAKTIPGAYFDLVNQSFAELGPDMHELYLSSTLPSELPIYHSPRV